jgi:mannose-6-phosphate isomerase-like protein (cupin superfamily)
MTSSTIDHRSPDPTDGYRLDVEDLAAIVADLADDPARWQAKVRFGTDDRWWTRLYGDNVVDVWLLTWVQDTGTDLHDHGESAGAFAVVSGELEEVRPDAHGELAATTLRGGDLRKIPRGSIHDVRSPTRFPAVSLHAYSPPLREMTFYEVDRSGPRPTRTVSTHDEGELA